MRRSIPRIGFTLIEVLVVVAIIALLVAILMPSLQRAREQARAVVCLSNQKQILTSIALKQAETLMRKERWSTNFGWAVQSLKINKGQTRLYTCPSDTEPRPMAAVMVDQFDGGTFKGSTASDGIFSRLSNLGGSTWIHDIQDQCGDNALGGDAWHDDDPDLYLTYTATSPDQTRTMATPGVGSASWHYNVLSYEGKTLWQNVNAGGTTEAQLTPLLWLSYSANAAAGLKNVKGNPILLAEGYKPGIFPIDLRSSSTSDVYYADNLARALRFRHGGREPRAGLTGFNYTALGGKPLNNKTWDPTSSNMNSGKIPDQYIDRNYVPRAQGNVGFLDCHAETLGYNALFKADATSWPNSATTAPTIKSTPWLGQMSINNTNLSY